MTKTEMKVLYKLLFTEYPDIVTVRQVQGMLGISRHAVYDLLEEGSIRGIKVGNAYKIPKINVIRFALNSELDPAESAEPDVS